MPMSRPARPFEMPMGEHGGASGGGNGGGMGDYGGDCGGVCGILKLRDDVQMCGYKDAEVMWNILSISLQLEKLEATPRTTTFKLPKRVTKHRSTFWSIFFWISHKT
ncbi:unnamed protein product [Lupinus luteus]|uniref:Uncharacterized protein n=1 Tax=Lupinus luteus TaxID=3873 RepID=A0AAV1W6J4_LUPLU